MFVVPITRRDSRLLRDSEFAQLHDNWKEFVIHISNTYKKFINTEIVTRRLLWIAIAKQNGVPKDLYQYVGHHINVEYSGFCYPQDYFAYRT